MPGTVLGPGGTTVNNNSLCSQSSESSRRAGINQIVIQMQCTKNDNHSKWSKAEAHGAIKAQNGLSVLGYQVRYAKV